MSFVVAISGVSGSGKTTLARRMVKEMGALHICLDNYYRETDASQFAVTNFEDPAMIDAGRVVKDLSLLAKGESVTSPIYDFTLCRATSWQDLHPANLVVVEGQYTALYPEIREVANLTVLMDIDWHTCMDRRVRRDEVVLHRSADESRRRFEGSVLAMYKDNYEELVKFSDLKWIGGDSHELLEMIRARLSSLDGRAHRAQ